MQLCPCTASDVLQQNNSSSVGNEVDAGGGFTHPMHLHGHHFQIVAIGYGTYNQSNGFLLSRNEDIDCGDALCSSPGWRGGQQPTFTASDKLLYLRIQ